MTEAKKHEIRQRQLIKRLEHEENIANIGAQWQHEILPNWNLLLVILNSTLPEFFSL